LQILQAGGNVSNLSQLGEEMAEAMGLDWSKESMGKNEEQLKQMILDWYKHYYNND
jgi:hypothetical protein